MLLILFGEFLTVIDLLNELSSRRLNDIKSFFLIDVLFGVVAFVV